MLSRKLAHSRARIALIDADSVLYASCLKAERKTEDGSYLQVLSEREVLLDVKSRLEELVDDVHADDAIVCLSVGRSFRYDIWADYKSNRKSLRKPPLLQAIKDALIQARKPYGVLAIAGLEADDICGISSTALQRADLREPVIVSIDKDMRTVPGLSYSWMREDDGIIETSEREADEAHLIQTLMGDVVDGYHGCPGIGKGKAKKLIDGKPEWSTVLDIFLQRGSNENEALTNARLAYILRDSDWNINSREINLWQPRGSAGPIEKLKLTNLPEGPALN